MTSHGALLRGRRSLLWLQGTIAPHPRKLSARPLALIAILGATIVGTTGCAAQAGGLATAAATNHAQAGELCRSVLGLDPAFRRYQDCVASLAQSAARLDQARALQTARDACLAKGANAGPGGLPECELRMASAVGPAAAGRPERAAAPAEARPKPYAYAAYREIRQRERLACARLGFEPIQQDFSDCVTSLDAALSASDHSAH